MIYVAFVFYPKWKKNYTEATISWDASGYYLYLPAIFIYKDIKKCEFMDSVIKTYQPTPDFQQAFIHQESGNYVMKYTLGQSLLMAPFFILANEYVKINDNYPQDGFSKPYQIFLGIGMFIYAIIGLFFLRKVLIRFFDDMTVAVVLFLLVIGTNYLNYSSVDSAMTHNTLFTLYALLVYATLKFYENLNIKYALFIGIITGLMTLIRPSELIAILIPILWGINNFKQLKLRLDLILQKWNIFIFAIILFLSIASLQLIYWKYVSGHWLIYSYQDQGFSWLEPHVENFTFSYKCGWLLYCPMMIIPIIGMYSLAKRRISNYAILGFLMLNFYIVTAWDVWDYGSNSGRAIVQSYPLFAFAFASIYEDIIRLKWIRYIFFTLVILFMYQNIWWTYNSHFGRVQVNGVSKEYFWKTVGRWKSNQYIDRLLENKHSFIGVPTKEKLVYSYDFNSDTSSSNILLIDSSNKVQQLNKDLQASKFFYFENSAFSNKWIRASFDIKCIKMDWDFWKNSQFIIKFFDKNNELVQSNMIRIQRFINENEEKEIFIDAKIPEKEWSHFEVFIWNADSENIINIDNFKLITFDN